MQGVKELERKIDRTKRYLQRGALLRTAGIAVLRHSAESFDAARDPETGQPWPALSPDTAAKPRRGPLNVNGRLRDSVNPGGRGNIFRLKPDDLEVGSSDLNAQYTLGTRAHPIVPRGSVLAWSGAGGMRFARRVNHPGTPPRRILGVDRRTEIEIEIELARDVEREMRRG